MVGRAVVIVPNGVLFGSGKADKKVRELLLTTCDLQAVIALPSGVFKPYSGVGTAIFIFEKGRTTKSVWFYELTADGLSLDDKRAQIEVNDIPDLIAKWPNREEGPNSFNVSMITFGIMVGSLWPTDISLCAFMQWNTIIPIKF